MLDQPQKTDATITNHNIKFKTGTDENNSPAVDSLSVVWTIFN